VKGLIDPLYNGIIGFIILTWFLGKRYAGRGRTRGFVKKYRLLIACLLWAMFLGLSAAFLVDFGYFAEIHDIDNAVDAATASLEDGVNPYTEPVVPRFEKRYCPDVGWTYGTYNYLPFDLLVYAASRTMLGFMGTPMWFVATNICAAAIAWTLLQPIVRTKPMFYIPVVGTITLFYAFDNAMLTLALMAGAIYASRRLDSHPRSISLILFTLAGLTKAYALLPLGVVALYELQSGMERRDGRGLAETTISLLIGCSVALAVIIPFGIGNVLDSAVLFHTSTEARAGTSSGGTLLAEAIGSFGAYALVAGAILLASVVAGMRLRSDAERVVLAAIALLLVIPKSSYAPLTVAGLFLALWLRETADTVAASLRVMHGSKLPDEQSPRARSSPGPDGPPSD